MSDQDTSISPRPINAYIPVTSAADSAIATLMYACNHQRTKMALEPQQSPLQSRLLMIAEPYNTVQYVWFNLRHTRWNPFYLSYICLFMRVWWQGHKSNLQCVFIGNVFHNRKQYFGSPLDSFKMFQVLGLIRWPYCCLFIAKKLSGSYL